MSFQSTLKTEITYLKGIGPQRADVLTKELGVYVFKDLLNHFPFRYIDKTKIYKISEITTDTAFIQVKGEISSIQEVGQKRGKRLVVLFFDDSGSVELVWFKRISWVRKYLIKGQSYLVYGKPSFYKSKLNIVHPEMELYAGQDGYDKLSKYQPVYHSTEKLSDKGLDSRGISKLQKELWSSIGQLIKEVLPENVLTTFKLIRRKEAYKNIHFPESTEMLEQAQNRLKFEELFLIQIELLKHKWNRSKLINGHVFSLVGDYLNNFYNNNLPFELTSAQKRVIKEIRDDIRSGRQMNRLLQGDVGSGKTVVALMIMLIALDNKMQACLMAPTEILAIQHFQTINSLIDGLDIEVALLTGSTKTKDRKIIDEKLRSGEIQMLIGTHAVIEESVVFNSLGFVVIDEQHRFGVAQRARLWKKNKVPPHVLVMTATPIPRTLAMTLYGDLDTSVIDELPPGRKEIDTKHYYEKSRLKVFSSLHKILKEGRQVYIVYPLIEESEKVDLSNLKDGYDVICREFPRPEYQVGIVHGRMTAEQKETEMNRFKNGQVNILVSTTVIEVGVDVPNATVMVIESAERFGLSQLHQLRGRVGRGGNQSYCVLMTSYKLTNDARVRMETMTRTTNGFEIAEVDLKLRGPGDLAGTQQSGLLNLKIANLTTDHAILKGARFAAQNLIEKDPKLLSFENRALKEHLEEFHKERTLWGQIS